MPYPLTRGWAFVLIAVVGVLLAGVHAVYDAGLWRQNSDGSTGLRYKDEAGVPADRRKSVRESDQTTVIRTDVPLRKVPVHIGEVHPGQIARFQLHFLNDTGNPMEASISHVSCGCLSLRLDAERVEPGDTVTCHCALDLTRRSAGIVSQRAMCSFRTNGRVVSRSAMHVSALVQGVWVVPGSLSLSDLTEEETVFSVFVAGSGELQKLTVGDVPANVAFAPRGDISTIAIGTADPAVDEMVRVRQYGLTVAADRSQLLSSFVATLKVPGAIGDHVKLPVSVHWQEDLRAEPTRIVITDVPLGKMATTVVTLQRRAGGRKIPWNDIVARLPIEGASVKVNVPYRKAEVAKLLVTIPIVQEFEHSSILVTRGSDRLCAIPVVVIGRSNVAPRKDYELVEQIQH